MNDLINELENKMSNLSIDELDNIINKMGKMQISKRRDSKLDKLINSMSSLKIVPDNKKIEVVMKGMKKIRNRKFNGIYKSLKGKKTKPLSQCQINDIFATMDALKK